MTTPPRILLAADNAIDRAVLIEQLRELGYAADALPSDELRDASAQEYDLVLVDAALQTPRFPCPRRAMLVALSADPRDAADIGVDVVIEKPAELDALRHVIERAGAARDSSDDPPVVDMVRLVKIFNGNRETAVHFLLGALPELRVLMRAIEDAEEIVAIEHRAHELKGTAANLGAAPLAAASDAVVRQARAGVVDRAAIAMLRERFAEFDAAARRARADVRAQTP